MIGGKLEALGLASAMASRSLLGLLGQAAEDTSVDTGTLAALAQIQRWASINLEIAEAAVGIAEAEALNHTLAAELEAIAREVALIRTGLSVDAA